MKLDPRALLLLTVVAMSMAVVGWASPAPNSFTQALADTLYCAIASANCLANYCNSPAVAGANADDNCLTNYCAANSNPVTFSGTCLTLVNYGFVRLYMQNTTSKSYSASTFSVIRKSQAANWNVPNGVTVHSGGSDGMECIAIYQFQVNNALTVGTFRLRNTSDNVNSFNITEGPGLPLNAAEVVSIMYEFLPVTITPQIEFDVAVSGGAGSVTVGPGSVLCHYSFGNTQLGATG